MCEQLLLNTLEGKIQVHYILKWLINQRVEDDNLRLITTKNCFQSDFVSYFLNYIHDMQISGNDKNGETPQKTSTPKRLDHVKEYTDNEVFQTPKRRPALFGNSSSADLHEHPVEINRNIECTPKGSRYNLNASYTSPLSPLYNRQNFITSKYSVTTSSPKAAQTLCLGDFIINNRNSLKKKVQKSLNDSNDENYGTGRGRRINPTNLAQRKYNGANFRRSGNSFTFRNEADEVVGNSDRQRSFLVEEKMKIVSRKHSGDNLSMLSVQKALVLNRKSEIVPSPDQVSFKQQLDILIVIYSFLLDHSFVLNLASELFFLINALLSKEFEEDTSPNSSFNLGVQPLEELVYSNCDISRNIFKTIHSRIYFVVRVLEKQINIMTVLDRSILRLLIENRRLQQFGHPRFLTALIHIHEHKSDRLTEVLEQGIQPNVCFISDTDNRDNFPSDPSFHAFRKQRDLFYEILRIWENNHLQNEWNFVLAFGGKIKALLNMHQEPANLIHFARLFKAQLLMNTCGRNAEDETIKEDQLSFLSSIPNVNAEKLSRLKSRIVSKQTCGGINSPPIFTGYQEFYKDFILVAASSAFQRHLNDSLISEIIELNETKFHCSDMDDLSSGVDSSMQKSYLICIRSLRVLAKFVGFLESLPYKSECAQLSENVVSSQICVRDKISPNMNLKDILKSASLNKHLVLTIPWITKYLSMLDYVTLRLPYYEDICYMLFEVYYRLNCIETNAVNMHDCMTTQSMFLVKFCLGWLFEQPNFPDDKYYIWISQQLNKNAQLNMDNLRLQRQSPSKLLFLDNSNIVDQNILHVCCPYLQEIKVILSNDANSSSNSNVSVKHITPVTAVDSPTDLWSKRIQFQLEEAFFNGQPVSVRKTVEFVSERVASACVKEICNEIVPAFKKTSILGLRDIIGAEIDANLDDSLKATAINVKTNEYSTTCLQNLRLKIDTTLQPFMSSRITAAVDALLATDVLMQTKEVCVTITTRNCLQRVQQWINSHVNIGIFTKDFDIEIKKLLANSTNKTKPKPVFLLPTFGKNVEHNSSTLSGVKVVEHIRSFSWMLIDTPEKVSLDAVMDLLDSIYESVKQRCDLNEYILTLINRMLVDLSLLMIAHRSDMVCDMVILKMCIILNECSLNVEDLLKHLICPRNLMLLSQSKAVEISWNCFRQYLNILLKEKLLPCDILEAQVIAVCKQISDKVILKHLSNCIKGVISDYSTRNDNGASFYSLLRFLIELDLTVV